MEKATVYTIEKSEFKILHTADTHLGSRQYHSDIRRQDFFDSFQKVIQDAIDYEMDAVVHAGDLFDSKNPTIEDLIETISILTPLKNAGIPFLGIVGNHELKQNTQWLDIFESMGLAKRLGGKPVIFDGLSSQIHFYGMDNLSAPRLSVFDFSVFDCPKSCDKPVFHVLVLHQLLEPILPGQPLSCDDFTSQIPIPFDAVLLGDNHKYECIKHNQSWLTYPGSTERCSAAEVEPRSYNILTFKEDLSVTKRTIPTRDFVNIPIQSDEFGKIRVDEVYSKIDAYSEKIKDAVVFVELQGTKKTPIPISEIEEYILNKGAVVARIGDKRSLLNETNQDVKIVFKDPDEVVSHEIRRLNLTEAGFLLDGIIRDSETTKSNVTDISEIKLKDFLNSFDFQTEYYRENIYLNPSDEFDFDSSGDFDLNRPDDLNFEESDDFNLNPSSDSFNLHSDKIGLFLNEKKEESEFIEIEQLKSVLEKTESLKSDDSDSVNSKFADFNSVNSVFAGPDSADSVSVDFDSVDSDSDFDSDFDSDSLESSAIKSTEKTPVLLLKEKEEKRKKNTPPPRQYTLGDKFGEEEK